MSNARTIAKNSGVLLIGQLVTYTLGFFLILYTARYLGPEKFGTLSLALAITGIFSIFTDLGLSTITVRDIACNKKLTEKYAGNILALKIVLSLITFGIIVIIINLIGYSQDVNFIIYLMMISVILNSFWLFLSSIFQAHEKMEFQSLASILNTLILFILTLIAIYYSLDIVMFAVIYIISNLITLIYMILIYSRIFKFPKLKIDKDFWKLIIIVALPLSVASLFNTIGFRVDSVLLSIIKGNTAVGFYTAPYRLMEALLFVPAVFTSAIYPALSKFHISSNESLIKSYEKSFKYLFIISLPVAVGTTILANELIMTIYGSEYTSSIIALQILIWGIPFMFLSYFSGTLLTAINKQNLLFKITGISMALNIILNLIFIPFFSYVASSVITVMTSILAFTLNFYFISRVISKINVQKLVLKPILASLIMGLFILIFRNINVLLLIIISIVVYFTVLILLKTFTDEDMKLFKKIFKKV